MPYVEKRIKSGDLLEVKRYFSPKGNTSARADKESPSSPQQLAANEREAERWLMRKINTNFNGKKNNDIFATLTYREEVDEETAYRDFDNFIRRLRRYCKNNKIAFRWGGSPEKQGRWHHHLTLPFIPLDDLTRIWGKGRVHASILDPTNNYEDLASYLAKHEKPAKDDPDGENIKQPRRKFARRWRFSKNCKNPTVTVKEIKRQDILKKAPAAPRGYYLLPNWNTGCDTWGNLYQYFKCKKLEPPPKKRGKTKKPKRKG